MNPEKELIIKGAFEQSPNGSQIKEYLSSALKCEALFEHLANNEKRRIEINSKEAADPEKKYYFFDQLAAPSYVYVDFYMLWKGSYQYEEAFLYDFIREALDKGNLRVTSKNEMTKNLQDDQILSPQQRILIGIYTSDITDKQD